MSGHNLPEDVLRIYSDIVDLDGVDLPDAIEHTEANSIRPSSEASDHPVDFDPPYTILETVWIVDQYCKQHGEIREQHLSESKVEPEDIGIPQKQIFDVAVLDDILAVDDTRVQRENIRHLLKQLLATLIAASSSETHGNEVMNTVNSMFGVSMSPGVIYPLLHELDDEGVIERVETCSHTNDYDIADETDLTTELDETMHQHLVLGFIIQKGLEEWNPD